MQDRSRRPCGRPPHASRSPDRAERRLPAADGRAPASPAGEGRARGRGADTERRRPCQKGAPGHLGPCKRNPLRIAEIWTMQRRSLREAQVTWPCTGPSPGETVRTFPRELWEGPRLLHHPWPLRAAATPGQPPRSTPA